MKTKKQLKNKLIEEQNKKEIFYNLINCVLVFFISLASAIVATNFNWTWEGFGVAGIMAFLTALLKFKNYWDGEKGEYSKRLLNIIP